MRILRNGLVIGILQIACICMRYSEGKESANRPRFDKKESVNGPFQKTYRRFPTRAAAPTTTTTTREPVYPTPPKRVPVKIKDDISYNDNARSFGIASSSGGRWLIRHRPEPSKGMPWPLPQQFYSDQHISYLIDPANFKFIARGVQCELLSKVILRVKRILFGHLSSSSRSSFSSWSFSSLNNNDRNTHDNINTDEEYTDDHSSNSRPFTSINHINITVVNACKKYPSLESDESYDLKVKSTGVLLNANEIWGAIRGLETFTQIVYQETEGMFVVNKTFISDFPRFKHRGILLDTARHYLTKDVIISNLEAMAQNKMNVFHWHIVDDQSFPFQSSEFPDLSNKGAFDPQHYIYTKEDVAEIIEEARIRGIRVIPEFDTPGHTISWGFSIDNLLTHCFTGNMPEGTWGPLNPILKNTYRVLERLFKEILSTFPDKYLHLGGDEVPFDCWDSNPRIRNFINKNNLTDSKQLFALYERKLVSIIEDLAKEREEGAGYIVWQEVVDNGVKVKSDTIVEIWMGGIDDIQKWTDAGLRTIFASCWYLDYINYGMDWDKYYTCEHMVRNLDDYQLRNESLLIGGEACLWTEYADNENVISRLWPRASAAAERLWSDRKVTDPLKAAPRMEEHRCRMLQRGLAVGVAAGPGVCKYSERLPPYHRFAALTETNAMFDSVNVFASHTSSKTDLSSQYLILPWLVILSVCILVILINTLKSERSANGSKIAAILLYPVSVFPGRRKGMVTIFALFAVFWCIWSAPIWLQTINAGNRAHKKNIGS